MPPGSTSTSNVLAILEGFNWPSGVVRARIYKDLFERDGFDVEFMGRIAMSVADLVERVPSRRVRMAAITAGTLVNELRILAKAGAADVIYLSKVTSLRFLRMLRRRSRARIVLDFGDAVWLGPDGKRRDSQFAEVLRLVDAVTTDNEHTAAYVRQFGKACTVIPDSPQLEQFDRKRPTVVPRNDGTVVVGWIGTAGTLYNLELIADALRVVSRKHPHMVLRLVGVGSDRSALQALEGIPYSVRASYDQAQMIDEVFGMDVGLFPLQDSERSVVRGVLKASIYMCGEAAVIASPIGQVTDVIEDNVNGMLASTREEWVAKLDALVSDAMLRKRLAAAGLETVRSRFRTHQSWELLRAVLQGEAA
jgi:glycosyltransferase involved in cell wall biosynthesis